MRYSGIPNVRDIPTFFSRHIDGILPRMLNDSNLNISVYQNHLLLKTWSHKKECNDKITPQNKSYVLLQGTEPTYLLSVAEKLDSNALSLKEAEEIFWQKDFYVPATIVDKILSKYPETTELASQATNILWSEQLIDKYLEKWNWWSICSNTNFPLDLIACDKYLKYLNIHQLERNPNVNLEWLIIKENPELFDWDILSGTESAAKRGHFDLQKYFVWKPRTRELYPHLPEYYELESPSISTNKHFEWRPGDEHLIRSKCDFWMILRSGKVSEKLLPHFIDILDAERQVGVKHTKSSDFRDEHPVYTTGWENYIFNEHTTISEEFLKKHGKHKYEKTLFAGDAQSGHSPYKQTFTVGKMVPPSKLDISFSFLVENFYLLSDECIHTSFIHPSLYKLVSEYLQQRKEMVRVLLGDYIARGYPSRTY